MSCQWGHGHGTSLCRTIYYHSRPCPGLLTAYWRGSAHWRCMDNAAKASWERLVAARKLAFSTPRLAWKGMQFWGHHSFCYFWVLSPPLSKIQGLAAFLYFWISFSVSPSILFPLWYLVIVQGIPISSRIYFISKPIVLTFKRCMMSLTL